jgi:hypothetical protein
MSYESSSSIKQPNRIFKWNDPDEAKREFPEFKSVLREMLGSKAWVLSAQEIVPYLPVNPGNRPNGNAAAITAYENRARDQRLAKQKLSESFHMALSAVRTLLPYGSKARIDFDEAADIAPAAGEDGEVPPWTPMEQFAAGMEALKRAYSASTATDVLALRKELQGLDDSKGFYDYVAEFNKLVSAIRGAGHDQLSDKELSEWAQAGIKNPIVINGIALSYYMNNVNATHKDIFDTIGKWCQLSIKAGQDPYKVANTGRGSISANIARTSPSDKRSIRGQFQGCNRCWRDGHRWSGCRANKCAICGCRLDASDKTCPKWRDHSLPHRFSGDVPPWEKTKFGFNPGSDSRSSAGNTRQDRSAPSSDSVLRITNGPASEANSAASTPSVTGKRKRGWSKRGNGKRGSSDGSQGDGEA